MATTQSFALEPDAIEELQLRCWARMNYVPAESRDAHWHPVVLEEMLRKDRESREPVLAG